MNEYNTDEKKEYTERTAAKPQFHFDDNLSGGMPEDINRSIRLFKNTGRHIELFKSEGAKNIAFATAGYFHRLMENKDFRENSDIILLSLLNPVDYSALAEIMQIDCARFYENVYVFDDHGFLRTTVSVLLSNNK